jgi:serine/threonine protein kinase
MLGQRWRLGAILGASALSTVRVAEDPAAGGLAAAKIVLVTPGTPRAAALRERLRREAAILDHLRSRGAPGLLDHNASADPPFLVMTFLRGSTLAQSSRPPPWPIEIFLPFAAKLLTTLHQVHSAGIIHRDVKPGNIFLMEDGGVALIDFGLAKLIAIEDDLTTPDIILGTLSYMAPEQARGAALATTRSDVWSAAAVLYRQLCGFTIWHDTQPSLAAIQQAHYTNTYLRINLLFPRSLEVLVRALHPQPQARSPTPMDLLEELYRAAALDAPQLITQLTRERRSKMTSAADFCPHCSAQLDFETDSIIRGSLLQHDCVRSSIPHSVLRCPSPTCREVVSWPTSDADRLLHCPKCGEFVRDPNAKTARAFLRRPARRHIESPRCARGDCALSHAGVYCVGCGQRVETALNVEGEDVLEIVPGRLMLALPRIEFTVSFLQLSPRSALPSVLPAEHFSFRERLLDRAAARYRFDLAGSASTILTSSNAVSIPMTIHALPPPTLVVRALQSGEIVRVPFNGSPLTLGPFDRRAQRLQLALEWPKDVRVTHRNSYPRTPAELDGWLLSRTTLLLDGEPLSLREGTVTLAVADLDQRRLRVLPWNADTGVITMAPPAAVAYEPKAALMAQPVAPPAQVPLEPQAPQPDAADSGVDFELPMLNEFVESGQELRLHVLALTLQWPTSVSFTVKARSGRRALPVIDVRIEEFADPTSLQIHTVRTAEIDGSSTYTLHLSRPTSSSGSPPDELLLRVTAQDPTHGRRTHDFSLRLQLLVVTLEIAVDSGRLVSNTPYHYRVIVEDEQPLLRATVAVRTPGVYLAAVSPNNPRPMDSADALTTLSTAVTSTPMELLVCTSSMLCPARLTLEQFFLSPQERQHIREHVAPSDSVVVRAIGEDIESGIYAKPNLHVKREFSEQLVTFENRSNWDVELTSDWFTERSNRAAAKLESLSDDGSMTLPRGTHSFRLVLTPWVRTDNMEVWEFDVEVIAPVRDRIYVELTVQGVREDPDDPIFFWDYGTVNTTILLEYQSKENWLRFGGPFVPSRAVVAWHNSQALLPDDDSAPKTFAPVTAARIANPSFRRDYCGYAEVRNIKTQFRTGRPEVVHVERIPEARTRLLKTQYGPRDVTQLFRETQGCLAVFAMNKLNSVPSEVWTALPIILRGNRREEALAAIRDAFTERCRELGKTVPVVRAFLDESSAAAMAYLLKLEPSADDDQRRVVVIDIGGGTTDITVFEFSVSASPYHRRIECVGFDGIGFGGVRVTWRVLQLIVSALNASLEAFKVDIADDMDGVWADHGFKNREILEPIAEAAKRVLEAGATWTATTEVVQQLLRLYCSNGSATKTIAEVAPQLFAPTVEVSAFESDPVYRRFIEEVVERATYATSRDYSQARRPDAAANVSGITHIVLSGQASGGMLLSRLLAARFPSASLVPRGDPGERKQAVVRGLKDYFDSSSEVTSNITLEVGNLQRVVLAPVANPSGRALLERFHPLNVPVVMYNSTAIVEFGKSERVRPVRKVRPGSAYDTETATVSVAPLLGRTVHMDDIPDEWDDSRAEAALSHCRYFVWVDSNENLRGVISEKWGNGESLVRRRDTVKPSWVDEWLQQPEVSQPGDLFWGHPLLMLLRKFFREPERRILPRAMDAGLAGRRATSHALSLVDGRGREWNTYLRKITELNSPTSPWGIPGRLQERAGNYGLVLARQQDDRWIWFPICAIGHPVREVSYGALARRVLEASVDQRWEDLPVLLGWKLDRNTADRISAWSLSFGDSSPFQLAPCVVSDILRGETEDVDRGWQNHSEAEFEGARFDEYEAVEDGKILSCWWKPVTDDVDVFDGYQRGVRSGWDLGAIPGLHG